MSDNDGQKSGSSTPKIAMIIASIIGIGAVAWVVFAPILPGVQIKSSDAFIYGDVVNVGVRFDARINALHVDLGDTFKAGDVLAELDDAHLKAELVEAEAGLARAEAEAKALRTEIDLDTQRDTERRVQVSAELKSLDATISSAKASLTKAEREFNRFRKLVDDGVASVARLDIEREDRQIARSDLKEIMADKRVAKAELELADIALSRRSVKEAEVVAAESAIDEEKARVAEIKADLKSSEISALHDGIVTDVFVRAGGAARPSDPVLSYWIRDHLWIHAWVSEGEAVRIKPGMKVDIAIDAFDPDAVFAGTVDAVLVSPDGRAQTLPGRPISPLLPDRTRFAVRILPEKQDWPEELLPGMSARVTIVTAVK